MGIVGRTGSGKSSLVAVLFRLIDTCGGSVKIDGVDITTVGLDALRSRITIIPQEPVLMSGTVRYNLDPFGERTDAELLFALQRVGLRTLTLADAIDKQGGNMSAGERQLLCFARALCLTQNRIVVMDEPSSSLDMQTDGTIVQLVQDELRTVRKCTILTVAHRMETIIQADRVLVMRDGQVAEFDHPGVLLRKQNSEFKQIVNALGPAASSRLLHLAETAVSSLNFKKQVVDNESV